MTPVQSGQVTPNNGTDCTLLSLTSGWVYLGPPGEDGLIDDPGIVVQPPRKAEVKHHPVQRPHGPEEVKQQRESPPGPPAPRVPLKGPPRRAALPRSSSGAPRFTTKAPIRSATGPGRPFSSTCRAGQQAEKCHFLATQGNSCRHKQFIQGATQKCH